MIILENVTKIFKKKPVLQKISYRFEGGKAYLLKGTNGSGKTMFLRLLCKLIEPTTGTMHMDGKYSYGVVIENPCFLKHETVEYNLMLLASIRKTAGKEIISEWMKRFGLYEMRRLPVRKLSLGMTQRLALCQAFMESPDVILLDEPFNALDEENIQILMGILEEEKKKGRLIVVAAHMIGEKINSFFDEEIQLSDGKIMNTIAAVR